MSQTDQFDITCGNCRSDTSIRYDHSQGNVVCESCGLILKRGFIDPTSEYPVYSSENNNSNVNPIRVGGAYNEQHSAMSGGLGTHLEDKNPHSKKIKHQHQLTSTDRSERNYDKWVKKIKNWGDRDNLNLEEKVIKLAKDKFGELKKSQTKMWSKRVAAYALHWACLREKCVLLHNKFEVYTGFDKKSLWNIEREIKKRNVDEEKMKTNHHEENTETNQESDDEGTTIRKPSVHVVSVANDLKLDYPLLNKMKLFAEKLEESRVLDGKRPTTIAGVAMLAMGKGSMGKGSLTMDQVSSVCKQTAAMATLKATFNSLISSLKSSKDETEKIILKTLEDNFGC